MKTLVLNRVNVGDKTVATVVNANSDVGILEIYDVIQSRKYWEDDTAVTPDDITSAMSDFNGDMDVRINSRGGDVGAALAITNRLKEYRKGTVTTTVDGYAFSAAGMIAQAGTKRRICTGGIFMIHNPRMYPEVKSLSDLDTIKNNWIAHQQSILSVFENRTKVKREDLQNLMEKETYLTAEAAVEQGFFDEVHSGTANYAALNYLPVIGLPDEFASLITNQAEKRRSALLAQAKHSQLKHSSLTPKK